MEKARWDDSHSFVDPYLDRSLCHFDRGFRRSQFLAVDADLCNSWDRMDFPDETTAYVDEHGKISPSYLKTRKMARVTRLELATSGVTGRRSNQLSYTRICTCMGGEAAQV